MRVEDSSSSIDEKSVDVDPYERSNYTILMVIKYIIHESLWDTVAKRGNQGKIYSSRNWEEVSKKG